MFWQLSQTSLTCFGQDIEYVMSSVLAVGESPGKMYILATTLMVLPIVAVILRVRARRMTKASLAWDDFLVAIALVCCNRSIAQHSAGHASMADRD